ncbi:MAG: AraC family transcriptional regulator [Pseudomonas sp.]|uniref:helix-turn-helix domain-containing protein n=1 Tax=Pseudomonas sp. TaxID=306 RepID=UPI00339ADE42
MQNILILGNQLTLYIGPLPDIGQHRHSTSALCLGLHAPIRARGDADSPWHPYDQLFVPAGVEHALAFGGHPVAVLFFETQSRCYQQLRVRYKLSTDVLSAAAQIASDWLSGIEGLQDGESMLGQIVRRLLPEKLESSPTDPRVIKVLVAMQAQPQYNFTAQELAASVCLSPSRLSALFKQEIGLPLRRYRVWLRLRALVGFISQGLSLTEAALMAGFSDSAHFSNSCRKLLGIKPTDILAASAALPILFSDHL